MRTIEKTPKVLRSREAWSGELYLLTLVSNITLELEKIKGHSALKNVSWGQMQRAKDAQNEKALISILRELKKIVARQEILIPAWKEWEQAKDEAVRFVQAHNNVGHKGQVLFDRSLKRYFDEMSSRLHGFLTNEDPIEVILDDLCELVITVQNYEWLGNFCLTCGEPINSGQLYCFKSCRPVAVKKAERDRIHDYEIPSLVPSDRPKKPGSASRHGHGHPVNENTRPRDRKKGKGGRSPQ